MVLQSEKSADSKKHSETGKDKKSKSDKKPKDKSSDKSSKDRLGDKNKGNSLVLSWHFSIGIIFFCF